VGIFSSKPTVDKWTATTVLWILGDVELVTLGFPGGKQKQRCCWYGWPGADCGHGPSPSYCLYKSLDPERSIAMARFWEVEEVNFSYWGAWLSKLMPGCVTVDKREIKLIAQTCSGVPVCWSTEHEGPAVETATTVMVVRHVSHPYVESVGNRAFPIAAARVWNTLSLDVRSSCSLSTFKHRLKTELLSRSFPGWNAWIFVTFVRWPRSFGLCHPNLICSIIILLLWVLNGVAMASSPSASLVHCTLPCVALLTISRRFCRRSKANHSINTILLCAQKLTRQLANRPVLIMMMMMMCVYGFITINTVFTLLRGCSLSTEGESWDAVVLFNRFVQRTNVHLFVVVNTLLCRIVCDVVTCVLHTALVCNCSVSTPLPYQQYLTRLHNYILGQVRLQPLSTMSTLCGMAYWLPDHNPNPTCSLRNDVLIERTHFGIIPDLVKF